MIDAQICNPVARIEEYVAKCRREYPERSFEIDEFLKRYQLGDGTLMNNDDIMHGLRRMAKSWTLKRGRMGPPRSSGHR